MSQFVEQYDPTIEDSYRKQVHIDQIPALLEILDTAGQEELKTAQDQYFRTQDAFLLVYSITSRESFDNLNDYRNNIVKAKFDMTENGVQIPMILIGNKCDMETQREVTKEEALQRAKEWGGVTFLETSAKDRINVEQAFAELVRAHRRVSSGGVGSSGGGGGGGGTKKEGDDKKKRNRRTCGIV